jgi:hypothetical protein
MGGMTQTGFQHSIPADPRIKEGRINFTFRHIIQSERDKQYKAIGVDQSIASMEKSFAQALAIEKSGLATKLFAYEKRKRHPAYLYPLVLILKQKNMQIAKLAKENKSSKSSKTDLSSAAWSVEDALRKRQAMDKKDPLKTQMMKMILEGLERVKKGGRPSPPRLIMGDRPEAKPVDFSDVMLRDQKADLVVVEDDDDDEEEEEVRPVQRKTAPVRSRLDDDDDDDDIPLSRFYRPPVHAPVPDSTQKLVDLDDDVPLGMYAKTVQKPMAMQKQPVWDDDVPLGVYAKQYAPQIANPRPKTKPVYSAQQMQAFRRFAQDPDSDEEEKEVPRAPAPKQLSIREKYKLWAAEAEAEADGDG